MFKLGRRKFFVMASFLLWINRKDPVYKIKQKVLNCRANSKDTNKRKRTRIVSVTQRSTKDPQHIRNPKKKC